MHESVECRLRPCYKSPLRALMGSSPDVFEDETLLPVLVLPRESAYVAAVCVPGWRCWRSAGKAVLQCWMRSPERAPAAAARRGRCQSSRQKPSPWLSLTAAACRYRCRSDPLTCPGHQMRRRQKETPLRYNNLRLQVCGRILL